MFFKHGCLIYFKVMQFFRIVLTSPASPLLCSIDGNGQRTLVNRNHLLLRGCVVRNTTQVFGVVVYAGKEKECIVCAPPIACMIVRN